MLHESSLPPLAAQLTVVDEFVYESEPVVRAVWPTELFCHPPLAFGLVKVTQSEASVPVCTDTVSWGGVIGLSGSVMIFTSAEWSPG